ncbi:type IV secretion system DNA-binding domain-containing protein [Devosia sp. ZB163]|uniref:type IV secretion system DNA-binding domain-containing protein n=1 Tax=Devosia sp. ZB163 TaxID=3025938 RepID=UPI002360B6B4|nr:type IV secretion system DNA-binding domain-containing protein [Devosia sp. ZB163]MDC9823277.1 type IV secretion system DNA-binding domain-containing protein [Devosia sp. ZB163]
MNSKQHALTPVPDETKARGAAFTAFVLAAIVVAAFVFAILPIRGWNAVAGHTAYFDLNALVGLVGELVAEAAPIYPTSSDNGLVLLINFIGYFVEWLLVPLSFLVALPARLAGADLSTDVSIRLIGVVVAGLVAADLVFRHVASRAPHHRRATWIDGPRVLWFGEAIAAAGGLLRPMIKEAPVGVTLAPGLQLPRLAEHESLFIMGLPGSGKTVIAEGIMRQAVERKERLLCLDVKGGLFRRITRVFGKGTASVVGLGRGCGVWAIGQDLRSRQAAQRIAALLIPDSKDPVWSAASRLLFAGMLVKLRETRGRNWGWTDVKHSISRPVEAIAAELAPTMQQVAELLRNREGEPTSMALSTIFNMISHVDDFVGVFADMEAAGWPKISLAKWVVAEAHPVLVLQHDLGNAELSGRLIATMLSVVASELLSSRVEDGVDHGIWLFADELPRFSGAAGDVSLLASLGRSRGIRIVASAQSIAQLEEKLSATGAEALLENFGKVVICKVRPGKNAEQIAETLVGQATFGVNVGKDGEQSIHKLPALSPSEMAKALGLTMDWRGGKSIRAAVAGLGDVYVLEWKFSEWTGLPG